jgi:hypothetical protein
MPPEPHLGEVSLSDTVPTTGYYTYGFTIRATEEAEGGEEDNVSDYVISGYAWAYCTGVDTLDLD